MRAFHIPKTIDNDLLVTDHCPGFGTAAKFGILRSYRRRPRQQISAGVKIDVIMGRNAGFLTAASALEKSEMTTVRICCISTKGPFPSTNFSPMLKTFTNNSAAALSP